MSVNPEVNVALNQLSGPERSVMQSWINTGQSNTLERFQYYLGQYRQHQQQRKNELQKERANDTKDCNRADIDGSRFR